MPMASVQVRLTFLISLGKVVISEPGDDPRLNAIYAPYVHFAALPKFPKLCSFYLKHPAEWEKRQAQLQGSASPKCICGPAFV